MRNDVYIFIYKCMLCCNCQSDDEVIQLLHCAHTHAYAHTHTHTQTGLVPLAVTLGSYFSHFIHKARTCVTTHLALLCK